MVCGTGSLSKRILSQFSLALQLARNMILEFFRKFFAPKSPRYKAGDRILFKSSGGHSYEAEIVTSDFDDLQIERVLVKITKLPKNTTDSHIEIGDRFILTDRGYEWSTFMLLPSE